jgi:hypothetical protein
MKINITEKEGVFTSKFDDKSKTSGKGISIKESVQNLLLNKELEDETEEDNKALIFIREKMPEARRIALEFFNEIGSEPMMQINILHKFKQYDKQNLELRLNFLKHFGFTKCNDTVGNGRMWQIIISAEDILQHYKNQVVKFESTVKYFKELANQIEQIKNIEENENSAKSNK